MTEDNKAIIEKIEDVRNDLIQLGITLIVMLMLMEKGISGFYSLLIAAFLAFALRESYALGVKKYRNK